MILRGKLCYLHPFDMQTTSSASHIAGLNDPDIMEFAGISKTLPHTFKSTETWIEKMNNDPNRRLFVVSSTRANIGTIRVDIDWMFRIGIISIAITDKESHSKGIGTEAIQLISAFAFNDLMLHKLEAGILDGNIASVKAFTKAGYQEEGRKRENRILNGKYVDVILMGRINDAN